VVINLDWVSFVSFTGSRIELHFKDGGSHMRRFESVEEMCDTIQEWQLQTSKLSTGSPGHLSDLHN